MSGEEPEEYGTNWPAEFIQEVLDEYPDDEQISRNTNSGILLELLLVRSVAARGSLLDEARKAVAGWRGSESNQYRYTDRLEEVIATISRREDLHRRAREMAGQGKSPLVP